MGVFIVTWPKNKFPVILFYAFLAFLWLIRWQFSFFVWAISILDSCGSRALLSDLAILAVRCAAPSDLSPTFIFTVRDKRQPTAVETLATASFSRTSAFALISFRSAATFLVLSPWSGGTIASSFLCSSPTIGLRRIISSSHARLVTRRRREHLSPLPSAPACYGVAVVRCHRWRCEARWWRWTVLGGGATCTRRSRWRRQAGTQVVLCSCARSSAAPMGSPTSGSSTQRTTRISPGVRSG